MYIYISIYTYHIYSHSLPKTHKIHKSFLHPLHTSAKQITPTHVCHKCLQHTDERRNASCYAPWAIFVIWWQITLEGGGERKWSLIQLVPGPRGCRRRRALKRGKFLLKTEAKHYWLIDSDEARSRSIHHSQLERRCSTILFITAAPPQETPTQGPWQDETWNQHWHWFRKTDSEWSTTILFTEHCRIHSTWPNRMNYS